MLDGQGVSDVERLRVDGLSIAEIAQTTGIPRSTVGDWLRGVPAGPHLYAFECEWCGDLATSRYARQRFCCKEHNIAAQNAKRPRA